MKSIFNTLFDRDGESEVWTRLWHVLLWIYGLVILLTFHEYGVTSDEHHHVKYGRDILHWYFSLFRDHTVFQSVNTWLYGGFFDLTAYVLAYVLPLDVHDTRHLYCAVMGLVGVVAAYRIGCLFGGPRVGFVAALCLVLTPRYYGHAFNNTKDIPFAVFYLWSVYYLLVGLGKLPHLSRGDCVKIGVALGLTMAIRSNGVVLFFYLGLGFGMWYVWQRRSASEVDVLSLVKQVGLILLVSYAVLLPFWPWLQLHPLTGLWDGVLLFASFSEVHYSFFEGSYVASDEIAWYYAPRWLLLTLPEFVLFGSLLGAGWFVYLARKRSAQVLQWSLVCFAGVFPLMYAVISGTPLYDGLRQMLFVVPPLVVMAGVGFDRCVSLLGSLWHRVGTWCIMAIMLLLSVWDMVVLHPNEYVYFNRVIAGGLEDASGAYETDYWNHSYKQGLRWVEGHYEQFVPAGRLPRVASLYPHLKEMVDQTEFDLTEPEDADFYLANTRYDHHRAVPGEVLHTVDVRGVPLLYVIRPDSIYRGDAFFDGSAKMHDRLGDVYRNRGHLEASFEAFEQTLGRLSGGFKITGLDSAGVLLKMGNVQLELDRYDDAMATFARIEDQKFYEGAIANTLGYHFITKKKPQEAILWLKKAITVAPDFYNPYVSLGTVYWDLEDTAQTVAIYKETARRWPVHSDRQFELGNMLYKLEAFDEASTCFRRIIKYHHYDVRGPYYLGLTLSAKGDVHGAREAFEQAVEIDPGHLGIYQSLGTVYMRLKNHERARVVLERAIGLAPDQGHLYAKLGLALIELRDMEGARAAFDRALEIDPDEPTAREYRQVLRSVKK